MRGGVNICILRSAEQLLDANEDADSAITAIPRGTALLHELEVHPGRM